MKLNLKSITLSEQQLDNLVSEFYGKILSLTEESSEEIELKFKSDNHEEEFKSALNCFLKRT